MCRSDTVHNNETEQISLTKTETDRRHCLISRPADRLLKVTQAWFQRGSTYFLNPFELPKGADSLRSLNHS